jgi:ABC-type dipeptide/oligopeptide/nickel transport system ATPase component
VSVLAPPQRELGLAYLFITHNISVLEQIAERVAVMQASRIVEQGLSDAVLQRAHHEYPRSCWRPCRGSLWRLATRAPEAGFAANRGAPCESRIKAHSRMK